MLAIIGSLLLAAIVAYLWGSLPSGYWMGKILRGKDFDIRDYGSRKTGATNVLRTLGKVPAVIVLLVDISKGIGPALLATYVSAFYGGGWGITVAGIAALLGHCYPVFIGFKGGRGVLTGAGTITTFGTIGIWRYVSLGSIVGSITTMICGIALYLAGLVNPSFSARLNLPQMLFMVIVPALVIIFHSDNISRLLTGKERKIGQKETFSATNEQNASSRA